MTKKDYEAIATILRAHKRSAFPVDVVADDFATMLAADNPRFDRNQFLAACRGEDYKTATGRTRRYSQA